MPMKIILKDYEVISCHGVNKEEKVNPQRFLFTAELSYDFFEAGIADDLTKTISYSDVKKTIKAFCEGNCFDLIETLAVRCAMLLLKTYPATAVSLTVKKPDAPMSGVFDYAGVSVELSWHKAYVALGSNLGDCNGYLDNAINALQSDDNIKNIRESSRVESQPYGGVATEKFVNSVCEFDTLYTPQQLLKKLNEIEQENNRTREIHWGNRTLDLDIIFYDDVILQDDNLCIPHPDMQNRDFVLGPLCELCKNKLHPILNKRVFELKRELEIKK